MTGTEGAAYHADWISGKGPGHPIVLASRARLARNIDGIPFPFAASEEELERARGVMLEAVSRRVARDRDWDIVFAEELTGDQAGLMAESHLVSPVFGDRPAGRAVALRLRSGQGVTVNEEEHARVHAVLPGARFRKAWEIADSIDNRLEGEVKFSFDHSFGYLASCPSNVGTGLRVSALMHLPALSVTGEIGRTMAALGKAGIFVRGLYGDGSGIAGNLFQAANYRSLGLTEEDIVRAVDRAVGQVAENERTARKMMAREAPEELADRVFRALGVLERARKVSYFEALELLSLVRLGADMELLPVRDFSLLEVGARIGGRHIRADLGDNPAETDVERERALRIRRLLDL